MEIKTEVNGDITILTIVGDLVASSSEELKEKVRKLLDKGFTKLVIVMGKVTFMDSSGLGACMFIFKATKAKSGIMVFGGISKQVENVLRITRTDRKLLIGTDKSDAVRMINEVG